MVGTWIDGKPVYQKTFNLVAPAVGGRETSIASIVSLNVDMVTSFNGLLCYDNISVTGVKEYIPFGWMHLASSNTSVFGRCTSSEILLFVTSVYTNKPVYVTIQYTKTTD